MKIKMNRGCIGGGKRLETGKTYESTKDMPQKDAIYLVNTGAATEIIPKGEESEARKGLDSKSGMKG